MSSATQSANPVRLPKWQRPPKTAEDLPWADVPVIDMAKFDQPGGKEQLAQDLHRAVHKTGFFGLVNTGFSDEDVQRQYDISQAFFGLAPEVKAMPETLCDFAKGNYFGYRQAADKTIGDTNVMSNIESFNIAKFIPQYAKEPFHPFFESFRHEIADFSRRTHDLTSKLFTLFAILLELPEDYFSLRQSYDTPSEDHLRYMRYSPRCLTEDLEVEKSWWPAHTDFGSLTFLWSQDIAALQVETSSGDWKYVPPVDGGIVCNIGDTLESWSAGYLKATKHRVVRPPEDQASLFRQGLFYFARPGNSVDVRPVPSPLLKRLGLIKDETAALEAAPLTGLEFVREKVRSYYEKEDRAIVKGQQVY